MSTFVGRSETMERAVNVPGRRRYTSVAQALHWVMAGLFVAVLPLAWVMVNMPHTAPSREWMYTLHKSVGLTILVLAAGRLAWRARHPAPPLTSGARWEQVSARVSHWLLYLIMLGMPVSGYLVSAAGGHAVSYFDLFTLPSLPENKTLQTAADWMHVATGQWLVYALVVLHVAATAWHVAVRRDNVLGRMLPAQVPPA